MEISLWSLDIFRFMLNREGFAWGYIFIEC
jgi:hypothetical protein